MMDSQHRNFGIALMMADYEFVFSALCYYLSCNQCDDTVIAQLSHCANQAKQAVERAVNAKIGSPVVEGNIEVRIFMN